MEKWYLKKKINFKLPKKENEEYNFNLLKAIPKKKYNYVFDRTQKKSKREKNEIGIHSVRAGSLCGEHEIIFAGPNESISITHSAQSRDIFALGALKAAKFIINQKPGFYNINNLY